MKCNSPNKKCEDDIVQSIWKWQWNIQDVVATLIYHSSNLLQLETFQPFNYFIILKMMWCYLWHHRDMETVISVWAELVLLTQLHISLIVCFFCFFHQVFFSFWGVFFVAVTFFCFMHLYTCFPKNHCKRHVLSSEVVQWNCLDILNCSIMKDQCNWCI